jgi:hypothetical protein
MLGAGSGGDAAAGGHAAAGRKGSRRAVAGHRSRGTKGTTSTCPVSRSSAPAAWNLGPLDAVQVPEFATADERAALMRRSNARWFDPAMDSDNDRRRGMEECHILRTGRSCELRFDRRPGRPLVRKLLPCPAGTAQPP